MKKLWLTPSHQSLCCTNHILIRVIKMGTEEKMPRHCLNTSIHRSTQHTAHKRNLVRISRQLCDSALITQVLMLQVVFMPANMMSCMQQMEMKSDFALKLIKENRTSATGVYTAVSMVRENVFHCTNIKIHTYIRTCSQTVHT